MPNRSNNKQNSYKEYIDIKVVEGSNLPSMDVNGLSDPYCIIKFGSHEERTAIQWKTLNPHWSETFQFPVSKSDNIVEGIDIYVYDKDKITSDDFMGCVSIRGMRVSDASVHDLWLDLRDENGAPMRENHNSCWLHVTVQVRCSNTWLANALQHRIPAHFYNRLRSTLYESIHPAAFLAIPHSTAADTILRGLSDTARAAGPERCAAVLWAAVWAEIGRCHHPETVFRNNAIPARFVSAYIAASTPRYVDAVAPVIRSIVDQGEMLEIDEQRAGDDIDIQANARRLCERLREILDAIFNVTAGPELRLLCRLVHQALEQRFGSSDASRRGVGGMFFLRFLNPVIVAPHTRHVLDTPPPRSAARTLTLLAKIIQALSNGVLLGSKESYMAVISEDAAREQDRVDKFLDELAGVEQNEEKTKKESSFSNHNQTDNNSDNHEHRETELNELDDKGDGIVQPAYEELSHKSWPTDTKAELVGLYYIHRYAISDNMHNQIITASTDPDSLSMRLPSLIKNEAKSMLSEVREIALSIGDSPQLS
eukprot:gb/GECH01006565.1/.p1 GENE.gb/GECH01006565.1/~~gb/GECH01006565.1/.p1  ORF type:complete len:538 (+),score=98.68 gb/GECH01006565.1/:1-1614(+)